MIWTVAVADFDLTRSGLGRHRCTMPAVVPAPELVDLRRSIDNIDATLVCLLAERFKQTHRIGALEAQVGLPAGDPRREAELLARLRGLATTADLDPDFAEKVIQFLIEEVIRHHDAIARREDP